MLHGAGAALALGHLQVEGLAAGRLVLLGGGVVVDELDGRYVEVALMAGYSQELINHRAFHAVGGESGLVGYLRVVGVKVFGEVDHRLLDKLQVSRAAYHHLQRHRLVGLQFMFVNSGLDVEVPHSAREVGRPLGQRVHLYGERRSLDLFLHFRIAAAAVEECLKGVYIAVAHEYDAVVGDAGNLQRARNLRKHHVLAPRHRAVAAPVELLYLEALLLWQGQLLRVEALQVGHLAL